MKLEKYTLVPSLYLDLGKAESAAESAQTQINNIMAVCMDDQTNKGKAYEAFRDYLNEVRIPVLQLHLMFYCQFGQDIKGDISALEFLPWGLGDIIDTLIIVAEIAALNSATAAAALFAFSPIGLLIPGSVEKYQAIKQSNDEAVSELLNSQALAEAYANNSAIYAATKELAAQLDKANLTLSEVKFDSESGTYDLSGISDPSWKDNIGKKYWEYYNTVLLGRYFFLDENGNPTCVKPEMAEELWEIINKAYPYVVNENGEIDLSNAGNFSESLSYDEKYLLLYLVSTYGDEVFAFERDAASGILGGLNNLDDFARGVIEPLPGDLESNIPDIDAADTIKGGIFGLASLFGDDQNNPLSNYLSFIKSGNSITSIDSPNSFQANGGFSDVYDLSTKFLGMDIDTHITTFTYNGKEYRLQVWDGQYGAGTHIGGEIGLYSRPESEAMANPYIKKDPEQYVKNIRSFSPTEVNNMFINYDTVRGDEQIPMVLHVVDKGGQDVVTNDTRKYIDDGTHYWNFKIEPQKPNNPLNKSDTHVVGDLTFEDPGMRQAAKDALIKDGHQVSEAGDTLTVTWE